MAGYDLTRFRATHNSYSGAKRGSLRGQLDQQIRFLELDFHDDGYAEVGDFRVGHLSPGSELAKGSGNPDTPLLRDWLQVIADWSAEHPGHTPITIVLDAKDDLNDGGGDLADLNQAIESVFGNRLFTRAQWDRAGGWPDTDELRDRILCVLSGHGANRASYRWTFGATPAIAANAGGDAVLTYVSSSGDVCAWVGRIDAATMQPAWLRKTTYGFAVAGLSEPSISINDDGWIVVVRAFRRPAVRGPSLESMVGELQAGGRIRWHGSRTFAQGVMPTLQIQGDEVREIHTMADGRQIKEVHGTLDRRKHRVEWQERRESSRPPFSRAAAVFRGHDVACAMDGEGLLGWSVDGGSPEPVRFRQVLFVEEQKGDPAPMIRDARFFAASAGEKHAIAGARQRGLVTRAWGFAETDILGAAALPVENAPATDTPAVAWYDDYMTGPGVAA